MNIAVMICMGMMLVLALLVLVVAPFKIGKPKEGKNTGLEYIISLLQIGMIVIIAGRIFGWW